MSTKAFAAQSGTTPLAEITIDRRTMHNSPRFPQGFFCSKATP